MNAHKSDQEHERECSRCQGRMKRVAYVSKMHPHPAYDIFKCTQCNFVEWVARGSATT